MELPNEPAGTIEPSLKKMILIELVFPIILLVLGIYHGLMQVLYRAGMIDDVRTERNARILAVIRSLREGEVVTYGDIAEDAGFPKLSRLVGRLLATVDDDLPWWRVLPSDGRLYRSHAPAQQSLLEVEGHRVDEHRRVHARPTR